MTTEQDKTVTEASASLPVEDSVAAPVLSRRALLRGASAAVPSILTLNSGVAGAVALSSNLIGVNQGLGPQTFVDKMGQTHQGYMCVETGSGVIDGKMDLGNPPMAYVHVIPDPNVGVEYRKVNSLYPNSWGQAEPADPAGMCVTPGDYLFQTTSGAKGQFNMPGAGGLTSATALSSFTDGIEAKNIISF